MSIGTALFLSVLVAIAAWQIEKRGAWRKVLKACLSILALAVAIGFSIWVWSLWQNFDKSRMDRVQADSIRRAEINAYSGINLGLTKNEVRYLKGEPTRILSDGR